MIFSATMFALALLGGDPQASTTTARVASSPTAACIAADRTGTFRIITKRTGGSASCVGLVVLENIDGCLEATFITDDAGPVIIGGLSLNGDTLKGNLKLSSGSATVSMQFTGTNVAGSIVQGRNAWSIEGRKTS